MSYIPQTPEEKKRLDAGKAGKLWRITVRYTTDYSNETRLFGLTNQYSDEVMHFRHKIFDVGLMVCLDPGHWVVIPPFDIKEIHIYKQINFFEP
jgi:hypothetical protein